MTPEIVLEAVCRELNISSSSLIKDYRKREVADARHIYAQVCKELMPHLFDKAVASVICRDRSSMIRSRNMFSNLYLVDVGFRIKYEKVIGSLNKPNPCHPSKNQTPKSETLNSSSPCANDGSKCTDELPTKSDVPNEPKSSTKPELGMQPH